MPLLLVNLEEVYLEGARAIFTRALLCGNNISLFRAIAVEFVTVSVIRVNWTAA